MNSGVTVSKAVLTTTKFNLNVTRESIATRFNDIGLIEVVPANIRRFDYDPVPLAPLGLLIEPEMNF